MREDSRNVFEKNELSCAQADIVSVQSLVVRVGNKVSMCADCSTACEN